jgi:acyl carrier protein
MNANALREAVVQSIAALTDGVANQLADTDRLIEDLGLDSMLAVNLVMAIEDRLGTALPDGYESTLVDTRTVGEMIERLSVLFAAQACAVNLAPVRDV